ncbi:MULTISPECIES: hypothetical protein [unclassified Shewanella]|jgi:hypothetical protein|uniref:hypothetical protein n=2 Tax=Shewanella TaxID=22 RepID=UPI0015FF2E7F|nr:hypothetical protein [Shewanella sp. SR43-8]MBB1323282.1 hypothetical protein [Shewanella sp. SR43-8]|tara:strand:+ start:1636 stop:3999 length:2364 start_codon:yes stop_codon:yes gene_type:complete
MLPKQLTYYPKLYKVLSSDYRNELEKIIFLTVKKSENGQFINVYSTFIDICVRTSNTQYNALDIRNSEVKLNAHLSILIGFIYTELKASAMTHYKYCYHFKKIFREFAKRNNMVLQNINISDTRWSEDVKDKIVLYKSMNVNLLLLKYYGGWTCKNKIGHSFSIHLANFHDTYGEELTDKYYILICNYAKKHKSATIRANIYYIVSLLDEFTEHCKTRQILEHSLKSENSMNLMEDVLNSMLFKSLMKNNDPKSFIKNWTCTIRVFSDCFIATGYIDEPNKPFILPEFKEPMKSEHGISIGGSFSERENERWLIDIPLEIKDDEALDLIKKRLERDLEHIRIICKKVFDDIKYRLQRNKNFRETGKIKPHPSNVTRENVIPVGINHLDNSVATFYHYGFGVGARTTKYLGFDAQGLILLKELCLPTPQSLLCLALLIILKHPKITPSWLQEWELYDRNGNLVGLKQVGENWIAVSFKHRKGATNAQQEVILTDYSKSIVDVLIEHTRFARESLKRNGGNDWRFVMLTANLQVASRSKDVGKLLVISSKSSQIFYVDSYNEDQQLILSKSDAKKLSSIVTLRSIRKARALQIYLETQSINDVSEALGHNKVRSDLIKIYLPEPLMNYFHKRWVRQFQNSIIFQALKDSPYLFDALDFNEVSLECFLKNHKLGDIPKHLESDRSNIYNKKDKCYANKIDELVFTLSTPLFQVLLAIQHIVDNATQEDLFKPIVQKWYESAVFILSHFSLSQDGEKFRRPPIETISLYDSAVNNPLNLKQFKENLLCRKN